MCTRALVAGEVSEVVGRFVNKATDGSVAATHVTHTTQGRGRISLGNKNGIGGRTNKWQLCCLITKRNMCKQIYWHLFFVGSFY